MKLQDFKEYISNFPIRTVFNYGISEPFSWRGDYSEVAFAITKGKTSREGILSSIQLAYEERFAGYKGTINEYDGCTPIHFEKGCKYYTDGKYSWDKIAEIEGSEAYKSVEEKLVKLAFH